MVYDLSCKKKLITLYYGYLKKKEIICISRFLKTINICMKYEKHKKQKGEIVYTYRLDDRHIYSQLYRKTY